MINNLFDTLDNAVVRNLSERPEALTDADFIKATAGKQTIEGTPVFDGRSRTPINQTLPPQILFALNLALLSEYFETDFYSRGLNSSGLIPNELRQVFVRLLLNEVQQRETLLTVLGANAIPKPQFDFTARKRLATVFSSFDTYSGLAQSAEDLGVRAYKGQAGNVQSNPFVLETALRFHSVEARHASELRRIRGNKGWITLNNRGNLPPLSQPIYNGEENVIQLGLDVTVISGYPASTVSEAFDEPLNASQVLSIVRNFIRGEFTFPNEGVYNFTNDQA